MLAAVACPVDALQSVGAVTDDVLRLAIAASIDLGVAKDT